MRCGEKRSRTEARIARAVHRRHLRQAPHQLVEVVAEDAVEAVADDLGQAARPQRDDGRAAGQRLDRHQAERLGPVGGHERRVARGEQLVAVRSVQLAELLHVGPARLGQEDVGVVGRLLRGRRLLGGHAERPPDRLGDAGPRRPVPSRRPSGRRSRAPSPGCSRNGASASERPLGTTSQATCGCDDAWSRLMATSPPGASARRADAHGWSMRPWNVLTTGTDRARARTRPANSRWAWMRSNDDGPSQDGVQRRDRVGRPVIDPAERPQGPLDGRDQPRRGRRVAAGEEGHLVAAPLELAQQLVDDPLGAAVATGWHGLQGRRHLGDAQRRKPRGRPGPDRLLRDHVRRIVPRDGRRRVARRSRRVAGPWHPSAATVAPMIEA